MPFWDRDLDILVATHPDADHVAGLVDVFDRYTIDQLITDGGELGISSTYDALLLAAEASETVVHPAQAGEIIEIGDGVRLEVVHPSAFFDTEDRNDNSVSFRLLYDDFSLLLTGDAEEPPNRRCWHKAIRLTHWFLKRAITAPEPPALCHSWKRCSRKSSSFRLA